MGGAEHFIVVEPLSRGRLGARVSKLECGVPIRSVSRSLAVLKAINIAGSMSLTEISQAARLPYATAARVVLTLLHEGMIEREPDRKKYRPTELVQSLASGYQDHSRLSSVARDYLVAFTAKHGWVAVVSTRLGMNMIVRDCTHSISPYTLAPYYPGFQYPILKSAGGRAYLAFCSETERELARKEPLASRQIQDRGTLGSFISEEAFAEIRAQGYATEGRNRFTQPPGKNSAISVPIFSQNKIHGVVSIVFMASAMSMDKAVTLYVQELTAMAADISAELDIKIPVRPSSDHRLSA